MILYIFYIDLYVSYFRFLLILKLNEKKEPKGREKSKNLKTFKKEISMYNFMFLIIYYVIKNNNLSRIIYDFLESFFFSSYSSYTVQHFQILLSYNFSFSVHFDYQF